MADKGRVTQAKGHLGPRYPSSRGSTFTYCTSLSPICGSTTVSQYVMAGAQVVPKACKLLEPGNFISWLGRLRPLVGGHPL